MVFLLLISLIDFKPKILWKGYEKVRYKGEKAYKNPLAFRYIGPYGGIIFKPISSDPKKVVAVSLIEYHKCENIFTDSFKIVIPYGYSFYKISNGIGVMSGDSQFVLARNDTSYYFTSDNFLTIDTVYMNAEIDFITGKDDTVYMIVGDSLLKSVDGGATFNFVYDFENFLGPGDYSYVMDVNPGNANDIFLYISDGYYAYSFDGGNTITFGFMDTVNVFSLRISHFDSNNIYMTTESGIIVTKDRGTTWDTLWLTPFPGTPVYPGFAIDVIPLSSDTFLLSSLIHKGIYKAFYDAFTSMWFYSMVDTTFVPLFFEPVYKNGVLSDTFYVGSNDGIYYTTNKGNTWNQVKTKLKAVVIPGPGAISLKKDTVFLISGGGIVYRSYDLPSGFTQLNFKGNLIFFGNNMIKNERTNPLNLYVVTPYMRLPLTGFEYKTLWFSNDGGNTFTLKDTSTNLLTFYDMFYGSNTDTLFLWNSDSIVRTGDGGLSFQIIYKDTSNIGKVEGEEDTIFILKNTGDTLLMSYNGGDTFNFASVLLNGPYDIYWAKGTPYIFYPDTFSNLWCYDIVNNIFSTVFTPPTSSSVLINAYPSEDGLIYALYQDTLTQEYLIYYKQIPAGTLMTASLPPVNEMFVGLIPARGGKLLLYSLGRGFYFTTVTDIKESYSLRKNSDISLAGSFVKDKVVFLTNLKANRKVSIFNIAGRKVLSKSLFIKNKAQIDISSLSKGTYYIKVENRFLKFVKF